MQKYLELGRRILNEGAFYGDRTKVGRTSLFGTELRFNLQEGFPLLTTKKLFVKGIIEELLWFLRGSSDVRELIEKGVHIWDDWRVTQELVDIPPERIQAMLGDPNDITMEYKMAKDELYTKLGSIGPLYGQMWRDAPGGGDTRVLEALHGDGFVDVMFEELASDKKAEFTARHPTINNHKAANDLFKLYHTVDQMQQLMINLKRNPHSSRHVISCWFPEFLPDERLTPPENVMLGRQALAPCHCLFQFYVKAAVDGGKQKLSCKLTQRSSDYYFGIPYNIASYSLLVMMIAQCLDMEADEFIWSSGDTHFYSNTIELFELQEKREPFPLPTMKINPEVKDLFSFKLQDFELVNYQSHAAIKGKIAV